LERNPLLNYHFVNEFIQPQMPVHKFMTIAALSTGIIQFLFFFNLFWSIFKGPKASDNPWESTSLEWTVPSPPPFDNFAGVHPVVNHGAYEYGEERNGKDYVMQTDPPTQAVTS
jgi:cytochrome c oxidase subunit 1